MTITGTDLETWAGRVAATSEFPALIRRLILATSPAQVSMRAGEGTRLAGFDGTVESTEPHPYIPRGSSVWEMGVNADRKGKADSDYTTRTTNPLTVTPTDTTFVFVTPRRWMGKDEWVKDKKAEGHWQDVRVIDADDLEGWLSIAPPVAGWLAPLLGQPSHGVHSVERYWQDWSDVTRPALTPDVILAGWNDDPVGATRTFLDSPPDALSIAGESREVAAVFLAATLVAGGEDSERHRARTLFIDDERAWTNAVDQSQSAVLVPRFEGRDRVPAAVGHGHHVVVPLSRREAGRGRVVNLTRQFRRRLREALDTLPLPDDQLDALATLGRRSLLSLRRKLAIVPAVHRPAWATPARAQALVAPVLAGAWYMDRAGDQEALAALAGRPWSDVEREVIQLATEDDPPLRRTGAVWMVTSKEDAWQLVAPLLTPQDVERFAKVIQDVLGAVDPALELPAEQRHMASLFGKEQPHSGLLREDLADSLALMGGRSAETVWALADTPQEVVDRIVRRLLSAKSVDAWASMAWVFPKLAEAAPEVFLDAVERALRTDGPPLAALFQDQQDALFGSTSPHTALLWALECLAWSPAYLTRVTFVLGRLAQLDPGGRLGNRPPNSLRAIFVAWYRNTAAESPERLQAIDALRAQMPEVACL